MKNPLTRCPVLFEDCDVIFVHKPSGTLSHPNNRGQSAAYEGDYDPAERIFRTSAGPLWLIHRLDRETSGVLLAAKTPEAAKICRAAFEKKEVEKDYLVLTARKPIPPRGRWADFISEKKWGGNPSHGTRGVKAFITRGPKPNALLHYSMKNFYSRLNLALLEIALVTGKTHQIRAQAAYHGHPVAGDRVYGNFAVNRELKKALGLNRIFLHARRLRIRHPSGNKFLDIETTLPPELERALEKAR
ncbi:MAG: Ribosomal large subunit pseudouridine synthase C [Candidatus Omnitrophica bacterium ADurb.Bin277]|nr:MAG: Ribosomal large subunit pseudouridine synthase C [Candidatus Omnitrophica bacterium ADurb.Bin277]